MVAADSQLMPDLSLGSKGVSQRFHRHFSVNLLHLAADFVSKYPFLQAIPTITKSWHRPLQCKPILIDLNHKLPQTLKHRMPGSLRVSAFSPKVVKALTRVDHSANVGA